MKLYELFGIGGNALGFGGGGGGSSFASGGATLNVIPKSNGAGLLGDSALTDNGTTVISTEPIRTPNGTSGAVGIQVGGANTGFYLSGSLFIMQQGGTDRFSVGALTGASVNTGTGLGFATSAGAALDAYISRRGGGSLFLGAPDVNGSPVAQTFGVQNAITGSNLAGTVFTIDSPKGTGNAAGAGTVLNRTLMTGTGTTAQVATHAIVIAESKTLSNTSATTTALATISLPSNSGGGCFVTCTLVATDGTNFDSETQSANVSYVNKAGAITVGTAQITASSAANNSGSATIGLTFTASGNTILVNATPVFTTIVPTTVTAYLEIHNHGTGNVTIN